MPRNNKEIVKEINQVSSPEMGARVPAVKSPDNEDDCLHRASFYKPEAVREAKEDIGAAKSCIDVQLGRKTPSGGILGDPTTQPNSGGEIDYEQFKKRDGYSPKNPKDFNSKHSP
jgi:hypothetical protein